MDDPFISCPYNSTHRVPRSRIQAHLVKCQEKCPALYICPFNATHRGTENEIKEHVKDCPTRLAMFPDQRPPQVTGDLTTPKPYMQADYLPETDPNHEVWDD